MCQTLPIQIHSLVPRLSLRHSGVQRSYVKIVRGEGEPGNEANRSIRKLKSRFRY